MADDDAPDPNDSGSGLDDDALADALAADLDRMATGAIQIIRPLPFDEADLFGEEERVEPPRTETEPPLFDGREPELFVEPEPPSEPEPVLPSESEPLADAGPAVDVEPPAEPVPFEAGPVESEPAEPAPVDSEPLFSNPEPDLFVEPQHDEPSPFAPAATEPAMAEPVFEPPVAPPVSSAPAWSLLPPPDPSQAVPLVDGPPTRRSLPDDKLAEWVDTAGQEPGSTLDIIEQLETQVRLRDEEVREFTAWEDRMRSLGTPAALAAVADARSEFVDVLPDKDPPPPTGSFVLPEQQFEQWPAAPDAAPEPESPAPSDEVPARDETSEPDDVAGLDQVEESDEVVDADAVEESDAAEETDEVEESDAVEDPESAIEPDTAIETDDATQTDNAIEPDDAIEPEGSPEPEPVTEAEPVLQAETFETALDTDQVSEPEAREESAFAAPLLVSEVPDFGTADQAPEADAEAEGIAEGLDESSPSEEPGGEAQERSDVTDGEAEEAVVDDAVVDGVIVGEAESVELDADPRASDAEPSDESLDDADIIAPEFIEPFEADPIIVDSSTVDSATVDSATVDSTTDDHSTADPITDDAIAVAEATFQQDLDDPFEQPVPELDDSTPDDPSRDDNTADDTLNDTSPDDPADAIPPLVEPPPLGTPPFGTPPPERGSAEPVFSFDALLNGADPTVVDAEIADTLDAETIGAENTDAGNTASEITASEEEPPLHPDAEPADAPAEALFVEPTPFAVGELLPSDTGSIAVIDQAYEEDLDDDVDETDRIPESFGTVAVDPAGIGLVAPQPFPPSGPIATARIPHDESVFFDDEPVKMEVFSLETAGLEATPVDRRVGHAARMFWLWFATNSSILSLGLGAAVFAVGLSLRQSLIAVVAGVALSFIPLGLTTLAGKRSGQPTMVVSRATFGLLGNVIPALLALVTRLFWGAVLLWLLGSSIAVVLVGAELGGALGERGLQLASLAGAFVVALLVAFAGYPLFARLQLILSIISGVLVVGLIALTVQYIDVPTALTTPDGPWLLTLTGAVLVFSFVGLVWAHSGADLARYQRVGSSGASSMLWATFGSTLPTFLLIAYGALLAASDTGIARGFLASPLDTLATMLPAWYPAPLIAAATLSLLSGITLSIYSGGFALQSLGVRVARQWSVVIVGVLLAALALVLAFGVTGGINDVFRDAATTLAVPTAAWAGIFAAETIIRNRRYESQSLLKRGGVYADVRWVNLIALILVTVIGYGFTSAAISWLSWQGYGFPLVGVPLDSDLATTDLGVLVALGLGLLVPVIAGIPAIRKQEAARL